MAIAKALNPLPSGLSRQSLGDGGRPVEDNEPDMEFEFEVDADNDADNDAGDPDEEEESEHFNDNLAEYLDEKSLTELAGDLLGDFETDVNSRKDWIQTYVDGLELLGMKIEDRTEPWPGACGVYHPLLSEALVKFQAETMMETFPAAGPVRTQIIGKETPEKKEAAVRVEDDMNYQLTDRMVEYRPEHERMLWGLGLAGNAFKKVYYDPSLQRQVSLFVPAEDVVVPYGASSLQMSERVTHVMRKTENEVKKLQKLGFYCDVDLGEPTNTLDEIEQKIAEKQGFNTTSDDRFRILEMHVDCILPEKPPHAEEEEAGDIALPYVITIEKGTQKVLAIRRNWRPEDDTRQKRNHFVHYPYIPGFGFYAFGLIHLVGAFAKAGTSIIRQLVDAGTLSNLPGGFKTKGLRVKGDDTPISPAEWRDVDVGSGTLRDNFMPLPYKEPSQVLAALLQNIIDEGRRLASSTDLQASDMSAQAPVGTTLAILERSLKVMSAIQSRIHYAMKQEFQLLKDIIRDYTPEDYSYEPEEGQPRAKKADYDLTTVLPVSDPNAATMAQKVVQYQAVIQLAETAPQLYDLPYLHRQMLEVLGIKNAAKLVPNIDDEDDMTPVDPVSENMSIIKGKPVKAFIAQDHDAHIVVHTTAIQDPQVAKLMGQNPNAQAMMAAMQAHIAEHLAFKYRQQIEQAAGVPYPEPDAKMDQATETQISRLAAAAAPKVLQQNQQQAAEQQAQQTAQDPIVQMQQQELAIKQQEAKTKETKVQVDAADKADRLELEKEKLAAHERIAGLNAGAKIANDKATISAEQLRQGLETGVEVAREAAQMDHTSQQKNADRGHQRGMQAAQQQHEQNLADQQAAQQPPTPSED